MQGEQEALDETPQVLKGLDHDHKKSDDYHKGDEDAPNLRIHDIKPINYVKPRSLHCPGSSTKINTKHEFIQMEDLGKSTMSSSHRLYMEQGRGKDEAKTKSDVQRFANSMYKNNARSVFERVENH